jgi:hypothetical protein
MRLCFGNGDPVLHGYTDTYYAEDMDSKKSTLGYLVTFARGAVSWQSRLWSAFHYQQQIEAEYIATTEA